MRTRPETPDFVDRAPLRVVIHQHLTASPDIVFTALADTPNWTAWWPGMTRAEWTSTQHGGLGAERRVNVRGLKVQERFIAWDPGERWGFTFLGTNVPLARAGVELVELTPDGAGTNLRYTMALEPPRFLGPVIRALRSRFETGIGEGVAGLDRYLRSDPTGPARGSEPPKNADTTG